MINIHQYFMTLLRNFIKVDNEAYLFARKAFNSYIRAYGRLPQRIYPIKALNLQFMSTGFGLRSSLSKGTETKDKRY